MLLLRLYDKSKQSPFNRQGDIDLFNARSVSPWLYAEQRFDDVLRQRLSELYTLKETYTMKEKIINEEALEEAMKKCMKGVSYKSSVAYFFLNSADTIPELHSQLENGTYKARSPKRFTINYPKKRDFVSIAFRDRVFQRSMNDNVVYPAMTKGFIYDNMACQKGKGTDKARKRMKFFLQDYWHKHGTEGYALKMDIRKYYDSIPHDVAEKLFAEHLDSWTLEQVCTIMREQYPREIGYNPGSQMIQILGISTPNKIDHVMKEKKHLKYYIRYQDDSIAIHKSKEYLEEIIEEEKKLLSEIGLTLNEKKTKIVKLTEGFEFLGFIYRLTKTGKVIMTVSPAKVKTERRHLRNMVRKAKNGELPKSKVDEHMKGVLNYYSKGNATKLTMRMQQFYKDLWKE